MNTRVKQLMTVLENIWEKSRSVDKIVFDNEGRIHFYNYGDFVALSFKTLLELSEKIEEIHPNWTISTIFSGDTEEVLDVYLDFKKRPKDRDFMLDYSLDTDEEWTIGFEDIV